MATDTMTTRDLNAELEILRQMLLLSRGHADSLFRQVDTATRFPDPQMKRQALEAFHRLPIEERERVLGTSRLDEGPCTD